MRPKRDGYYFSPTSRTVTVANAELTGIDFVDPRATYPARGYVAFASYNQNVSLDDIDLR